MEPAAPSARPWPPPRAPRCPQEMQQHRLCLVVAMMRRRHRARTAHRRRHRKEIPVALAPCCLLHPDSGMHVRRRPRDRNCLKLQIE